jgi:hypothetical protein
VDPVDARLIEQTVSLDTLPPEVQEWIQWGRGSGLSHLQLAERANEFVRGAYQYDLTYAENEAVKRIIDKPLKQRENRFLSALHAGTDSRYLGCGVCVELSAILLEILRHCGVPCALARVWMLDLGLIHLPDHAIVLALVPSDAGPYWLPLDPSGERLAKQDHTSRRPLTRLELLEKAADLILPSDLQLPQPSDLRQRALERELLSIFESSQLFELFLDCLANPGRYRHELSSDLLELQHRGLIRLQSEMVYKAEVNPK